MCRTLDHGAAAALTVAHQGHDTAVILSAGFIVSHFAMGSVSCRASAMACTSRATQCHGVRGCSAGPRRQVKSITFAVAFYHAD